MDDNDLHRLVWLEDTWVIKEIQPSKPRGMYIDYIQVEMTMMKIIHGMVIQRNKCRLL